MTSTVATGTVPQQANGHKSYNFGRRPTRETATDSLKKQLTDMPELNINGSNTASLQHVSTPTSVSSKKASSSSATVAEKPSLSTLADAIPTVTKAGGVVDNSSMPETKKATEPVPDKHSATNGVPSITTTPPLAPSKNATGRKPPVPPANRKAVDPRRAIVSQQFQGKSEVQNKKLQNAVSAMGKDEFESLTSDYLFMEVALHGDQIIRKEGKDEPKSYKEVIDKVHTQADSLKFREATKEVVQDGLVHKLLQCFNAMSSKTRTSTKSTAYVSMPDYYVASKKVIEGVELHQFTPSEQKEHDELKRIESAISSVGRTTVKVGTSGSNKVSDEEKERNKRIKEKLLDEQEKILYGSLKDKIEKNGFSDMDEFIGTLGTSNTLGEDMITEIKHMLSMNAVVSFNIAQAIASLARTLSARVEDEQRKETEEAERVVKEGGKVAPKKTPAPAGSESKRKRGEPKEDGFYDPAQHVKKEPDQEVDAVAVAAPPTPNPEKSVKKGPTPKKSKKVEEEPNIKPDIEEKKEKKTKNPSTKKESAKRKKPETTKSLPETEDKHKVPDQDLVATPPASILLPVIENLKKVADTEAAAAAVNNSKKTKKEKKEKKERKEKKSSKKSKSDKKENTQKS